MVLPIVDSLTRPLRSLRISVTDRCNLRCSYCMPEENYTWLAREELLSFEEIGRLARVFADQGASRLRLTGGEPLLRRDLASLVEILAAIPGVEDLALTTNAVRLADQARPLAAAGLTRVTCSLDTLDPQRFRDNTSRDFHAKVLEGIEAAAQAGFANVKINTVVMRGFNDDELVAMVEHSKRIATTGTPVIVRFIEYMDVGGATQWAREKVVSQAEILATLTTQYKTIEPIPNRGSAPAERFRLPDGTEVGVIASTTRPFCRSCDRCRVLANGRLFLCLYARTGLDLRGPLRAGASDEELAALVRSTWQARADRGAEERLALKQHRTPLAQAEELQDDPHLEMHTRGG